MATSATYKRYNGRVWEEIIFPYSHTHTFNSLASKPTTLSGYGITDAHISDGLITIGSNSIRPITSLSGYAKQSWVTNQGYLTGITKAMVTNALGFTPTANTGTVTSVKLTVPTGLSVTGSPITTSGTLAISLASGYSIPTTTKQANWDTAYGWGNHANAGYKKTDTNTTYEFTSGKNGFGVKDSDGNTYTISVTPDIGTASPKQNGLMTTTYVSRLNTMWNAWSADGTDDTLINKVQEVLTAFENFPEANNLVTLLAGKQPLDSDLTAIAGLSDTGKGLLKKTGSGAWALDTNTYLTTSSASSTYETKANAITGLSASGTTITYTKGNGTTGTITTQDTTYSFSANNPTLSWGGTATIGTAGGTTYKVTMPANPNTDTTNTAGATNKTGTKLFLVGAATQAGSSTTNTNSNVYIGTDNCLYSNGSKVLTSHQTLPADYIKISLSADSGTITSAQLSALKANPHKAVFERSGYYYFAENLSSSSTYYYSCNVYYDGNKITKRVISLTTSSGAYTKNDYTYSPDLSAYLTTRAASNTYLGKTAKAADSDKLDGQDGSYYSGLVQTLEESLPSKYQPIGSYLTANQTITLSGDATGSGTTSIKVTLANSGVTAGSYGQSSAVTGNNNSTVSIPYITVDSKGRVTAIKNVTYTAKNTTYSNATTSAAGLMSATDKAHLNTLVGLLTEEESSTTIDTITEVLNAFAGIGEGTTVANALAGKQNKVSKLGSTSKPVYVSADGTFAEASTYAGGTAVTLNGSGKGGSTASFYAPTGAGTDGYILKSSGSGAPKWVAQSTLSVGSATKATQDGSGNVITSTYASKNSLNNYLPLAGGTLNDSVDVIWTKYNRKMIINGNNITFDPTADTGTYAGSLLDVKHTKGTTTAVGVYGNYSGGLTHIFMGGSYYDPAMKMDASGNFTFKNLVSLSGGLQTNILKIPTSSGGSTFGMGSSGQVLKTNGSTVYWGSDNNTTYTFTNKAATLAWGTAVTIATVGGTDITVKLPSNPNTDTHYTTHLYAGSGTAANAATTNGNTKLTVTDNSTVRNSITIKGTGATTVTSDANGVITINSTDTNTWRPVVNNLTSTATDSSLSAAQGKALNDKFANYLPLAGGTMTGTIQYAGATKEIISFAPTDSTWRGGLKYSWSSNTTIGLWGRHQMSQFVWHAGTDFVSTDVNGTTVKTYDFQIGRDASGGAPIARLGGKLLATQDWTLTKIPTSLPASDVYSWAKASTKPSYTASEVGALSSSGGNVSGHIYLTGSKASSSTGNTSQIVFGTSSDNHIVLSSNDNALVINPTTSTTTNQIVLYLDKQSQFPSGITSSGTINAATLQEGGTSLSKKYFPKANIKVKGTSVSMLDLREGTNISLTKNSDGTVSISSTASGGSGGGLTEGGSLNKATIGDFYCRYINDSTSTSSYVSTGDLIECVKAYNNGELGGSASLPSSPTFNRVTTSYLTVKSAAYFERNSNVNFDGGIAIGGIDLDDYILDVVACLMEGTMITMADGSSKRIEEVKEGDLLMSYDFETGKKTTTVCLGTRVGDYKNYYYCLLFNNGMRVKTNWTHDIYNATKGTWTNTDQELELDDEVLTENNGRTKFVGRLEAIGTPNGRKVHFYDIMTSNNCYYADGVLFSHTPTKQAGWVSRHKDAPTELINLITSYKNETHRETDLMQKDEYVNKYLDTMHSMLMKESKLRTLKDNLSRTDYITLKVSEGIEITDTMQEILDSRKIWRKEFNEVEAELSYVYKTANDLKVKYSDIGEDVLLDSMGLRKKFFLESCKKGNANLNKFKEFYNSLSTKNEEFVKETNNSTKI